MSAFGAVLFNAFEFPLFFVYRKKWGNSNLMLYCKLKVNCDKIKNKC